MLKIFLSAILTLLNWTVGMKLCKAEIRGIMVEKINWQVGPAINKIKQMIEAFISLLSRNLTY